MPPASTTPLRSHGTRQADGVALVFAGTPRTFIGSVGVDGATGATMNMQLSAPASCMRERA